MPGGGGSGLPPTRVLSKCQQEVAKAKAANPNGMVGGPGAPVCESDGSYRPKQCSGSSGYCHCVDVLGNEVVGTSRAPGQWNINCADYGNCFFRIFPIFSRIPWIEYAQFFYRYYLYFELSKFLIENRK